MRGITQRERKKGHVLSPRVGLRARLDVVNQLVRVLVKGEHDDIGAVAGAQTKT